MNIAPNRLKPVVIGTFAISAISIMPLVNFINLFCCAGIIIGGATGAMFYNRQLKNSDFQITTKDGAITGLLAGILSAVIVTGVNLLMVLYSNINPINEILELLKTLSKDLPQEIYDQMKHFSDEFDRFGYSPTLALISLVINLIIYPLFASIGGILVALISISKSKTAASHKTLN
jgi:hypothetical protein